MSWTTMEMADTARTSSSDQMGPALAGQPFAFICEIPPAGDASAIAASRHGELPPARRAERNSHLRVSAAGSASLRRSRRTTLWMPANDRRADVSASCAVDDRVLQGPGAALVGE